MTLKTDAKLLIAGGCGFIGTNLIALLNRQGIRNITILDNETVGQRSYLAGLDYTNFLHGDMRDTQLVDQAMAGQDAVVALAAQTNVIKSIENPIDDFDQNIRGGLTLLESARKHAVQRFVFASSAAPLGVQPPPMHEDLAPRPASPYGASKLAMEGYCSAYYHSFGLKTLTLRFSNCYGPGSRNKSSVVAEFIRRILAGQTIRIYGDGQQTRDFIFVQDLCRAIQLALGGEPGSDAFGRVYQVATGVETTVNQLVGLLGELTGADGYKLNIETAPARAGEILRNYANPSLFRTHFGFSFETTLADGVAQTWNYFRGLNSTAA